MALRVDFESEHRPIAHFKVQQEGWQCFLWHNQRTRALRPFPACGSPRLWPQKRWELIWFASCPFSLPVCPGASESSVRGSFSSYPTHQGWQSPFHTRAHITILGSQRPEMGNRNVSNADSDSDSNYIPKIQIITITMQITKKFYNSTNFLITINFCNLNAFFTCTSLWRTQGFIEGDRGELFSFNFLPMEILSGQSFDRHCFQVHKAHLWINSSTIHISSNRGH